MTRYASSLRKNQEVRARQHSEHVESVRAREAFQFERRWRALSGMYTPPIVLSHQGPGLSMREFLAGDWPSFRGIDRRDT